MGTHAQTLGHARPAAAAILGGVRRVDRFHSLPGACCLASEDGAEAAPSGISDTFVETGLARGPVRHIPAAPFRYRGGAATEVGGLDGLVIDRVVRPAPSRAPSCGGGRHVGASPSDELWPAIAPPSCAGCSPSSAARPAAAPSPIASQRGGGGADSRPLPPPPSPGKPSTPRRFPSPDPSAGAVAWAPRHRRRRRTNHPPHAKR